MGIFKFLRVFRVNKSISIDLGTANILIYDKQRKKIVLNEPSVVARDRNVTQHVFKVVVGQVCAHEGVDLLDDKGQGSHLHGSLKSLDDGRASAVGVAPLDQGGVAAVPLVQQIDAPQGTGERELGAARPHVRDRVDAASAHGLTQAGDVGIGETLVAHAHEGPGGGVCDGSGGRGIFVADDGVSPGGVEHGGASRRL